METTTKYNSKKHNIITMLNKYKKKKYGIR